MLINQEQLLENLLPSVFISKITLETANRSINDVENNPHIDLSKVPAKIRDFTGKLVNPKLSPNLNNKMNTVFLTQGNNVVPIVRTGEKLVITVDLLLKERLDNGLIGTWFKNQNFSKYLRLKVIQSTQPILTQEATKEPRLLMVYDKKQHSVLSKVNMDNGLTFVAKKLNIGQDVELQSAISSYIQSKVLNVKDDIEGDKSNLTTQITEIDSDGNTITNFCFRTRFELNNQYPEHLAVFAYCYIDLLQLAEDFNFKFDTNLIKNPLGRVVSDIIIDG